MARTINRDDPIRLYLGKAQAARLRKIGYEERLLELRSRAERMSAGLSPVPHSGPYASLEAIWARLADEVDRYEAVIAEAVEEMKEIDDFIDSLHISYVEQEILRLRYCNGLSYEQIQRLIRKAGYWYSMAYLWELHGNALEAARQEYQLRKDVEEGKEELRRSLGLDKEEGNEND